MQPCRFTGVSVRGAWEGGGGARGLQYDCFKVKVFLYSNCDKKRNVVDRASGKDDGRRLV